MPAFPQTGSTHLRPTPCVEVIKPIRFNRLGGGWRTTRFGLLCEIPDVSILAQLFKTVCEQDKFSTELLSCAFYSSE